MQAKIKAALSKRVEQAAATLTSSVKSEAPVRTGELRDSTGYTMTGPLTAEVESSAPYAGYVNATNPYFARGIELALPQIKKELSRPL